MSSRATCPRYTVAPVPRLRWTLPAPLAGLLVAGALTTIAWAAIVPPFQGPDELPHYAYVQRLVEAGDLWPFEDEAGREAYSTEAGTAAAGSGIWPVYKNRAGRPAWSAVEEAAWERADGALGDADRADGTGRTLESEAGITFDAVYNNPPLYYFLEAAPYWLASGGSTFDRLYLMRLSNLPLRLLEIALVWLIVAELLAPLWARALAAGLVALHPVAGFIGATVNPDNLLRVEWALFLLLAIRLIRAGPSARRLLALALIVGASALTHLRGVPIVPAALAAVALAFWRHRPERRRTVARASAAGALAVAGGALVIAGLNFSGDRAPPEPFRLFEFASYVWQFYLPKLWFMTDMVGIHYTWDGAFVRQFFGLFGYLETQFPDDVYLWLRVLSVLGLIGLGAALVHRHRAVRRHWEIAAVMAILTVSLLAYLHFVSYRHLLFVPSEPLLQGRYILPLLPVFGLAVAFTVSSLPRAAALRVGATLLSGAALYHVAALGITMARFYV